MGSTLFTDNFIDFKYLKVDFFLKDNHCLAPAVCVVAKQRRVLLTSEFFSLIGLSYLLFKKLMKINHPIPV